MLTQNIQISCFKYWGFKTEAEIYLKLRKLAAEWSPATRGRTVLGNGSKMIFLLSSVQLSARVNNFFEQWLSNWKHSVSELKD